VAICGDTGTKLDRSVPAGFETVPQGIRVNLRVRDASGITTKPSNRTRCPPCIPHPSHSSRAQARGGFGVSSSPNTQFFPEARSAVRDRLDAAHASRSKVDPGSAACLRRPLRPLLRQGYGGPTSPHCGEERERDAFPGCIPGSGGVSDAGSSRPRHKAGGSGVWAGTEGRSRAGPFDPRLTPRPTSPQGGEERERAAFPNLFRGPGDVQRGADKSLLPFGLSRVRSDETCGCRRLPTHEL